MTDGVTRNATQHQPGKSTGATRAHDEQVHSFGIDELKQLFASVSLGGRGGPPRASCRRRLLRPWRVLHGLDATALCHPTSLSHSPMRPAAVPTLGVTMPIGMIPQDHARRSVSPIAGTMRFSRTLMMDIG